MTTDQEQATTVFQQMANVGLTIVSIAELEELRALKRKILSGDIQPSTPWHWNDCLAWLRETTDD